MSFDEIPRDYLREPSDVPDFWVSAVDDVFAFLDTRIQRGRCLTAGSTAGGRPIRAVAYGDPRRGAGTTTFSGALGCRRTSAYLGADGARRVCLVLAAVHGGEFEGIVGAVNLLSVLETGADLRGAAWPALKAVAERLDRLVVIPIVNADGRARIPLRMQRHRGRDNLLHEYFNTGFWADGTSIGWPQCKAHIPLNFAQTQFPGGYPNDAGVNLMHDDFLGARQPETQALLDLAARERPDLVLNMHTGAPPKNFFARMHRPFTEPSLASAFDALYRHVHGRLAAAGLQDSPDGALEGDPAQAPGAVYNLDSALNLHCGALSVTVESPSHSFSGTNRAGEVVVQTPGMLLDAQLTVHQAALEYLVETGGRCRWVPDR